MRWAEVAAGVACEMGEGCLAGGAGGDLAAGMRALPADEGEALGM
ncbi:hypothetical protein ACFVU0_34630 [Streptomyces sp. NPDC058122]